MLDLDIARESAERIFLGFVCDDHNVLHAFRRYLCRDRHWCQRSVDRLSARHRHRVVEQNFEGDIALGRNTGPDRQNAGVIVGPVPKVLEDVFCLHEFFLPNPGQTFTSHMTMGQDIAVHVGRHVVATDTAMRAATIRYLCRGIVGAAGAEIRQTRDAEIVPFGICGGARLLEHDPGRNSIARVEMGDTFRDNEGNIFRRIFRKDWQNSRASLVMLPDNARPPFVRQVVERALQLVLHHRMLFFDDEDFLETICEFAEQDFISRPRHPNLQHRDPEISAHLTV